MSITFNGSPGPSLGVELEFQVVDRSSRDLASLAPRLIEDLDAEWAKPELFQSTLEINTDVCQNVGEVRADLERKIALARDAAAAHDARLVCAGTHPFARWQEQLVTDNDRYHRLIERMRWPAEHLLIFGMHVHVGVPDGETAIAVTNSIESWLPHLLALTCSSPFWCGSDSGLASVRTKIFELLPTAGLPYRHEDWSEFESLVESLIAARAIESPREIWWDVRPHPGFGTVEVRVCDSTPTLSEAVAMSALVQALTVHLCDRSHDSALHNRIVRENKWRACRWSVGGTTIGHDGEVVQIADSLRGLLGELEPIFVRLGSVGEVERLRAMLVEPPSFQRQRDIFAAEGRLEAVVDALIEEGASDRPVLV